MPPREYQPPPEETEQDQFDRRKEAGDTEYINSLRNRTQGTLFKRVGD